MEQLNNNINSALASNVQDELIQQNGSIFKYYDEKLESTKYRTDKEKLEYLASLIKKADENLINNPDLLIKKEDSHQR